MRLSDKKNNAPIPYRDSKLTRILQPALEGDSKVSIICNISPAANAYDETLSTLKFAQRAKKIKQTIVKNEVINSKALIVKYQSEIQQLQDRLREMESKMSQEENKVVVSTDVTEKLLIMEEEKEISDAKLESILREKLQLQQDLERLKSFIIHSEDVKPVKHKEEAKNDLFVKSTPKKFLTMAQRPQTMLLESSPFKGVDTTSKEFHGLMFEPLKEEKGEDYRGYNRRETLLTHGIEDIDELFEDEDPLMKVSVLGSENPSVEECLKIIDEQKGVIEGMRKALEDRDNMVKIIMEQQAIIAGLEKAIEEKDDQNELISDELKLCRNNLAKVQNLLRVKNK